MENINCVHERLALVYYTGDVSIPIGYYTRELSPNFSENFPLTNFPILVCKKCNYHFGHIIPEDVHCIENINHMDPAECEHPIGLRLHDLTSLGGAVCVCCGYEFKPQAPTSPLYIEGGNIFYGTTSPSVKLDIKSGNVTFDTNNVKTTDLEVIGTLTKENTCCKGCCYYDIFDPEGISLLMENLSRFEGKKVRIDINLID